MVRCELRSGDEDAIVSLHGRVYGTEYGLGPGFVAGVREGIAASRAAGWPASGGVWLIDGDDGLAGSLALTDEGGGRGRVRWFVLEPSLRGRGLGRTLIDGLVASARAQLMSELTLETFSALDTAARLYRSHGFRVVEERPHRAWGAAIVHQRYVASLAP